MELEEWNEPMKVNQNTVSYYLDGKMIDKSSLNLFWKS